MVDKEKYTGRLLKRQMIEVMAYTVAIGVPIVMLFMVYISGGGLSSIKVNLTKFMQLIVLATIVVVIAVVLHAYYITRKISDTADFLDNESMGRNESEEKYQKRLSRAIKCSLEFPIRGAGLSLITWPSVLAVVMPLVYYLFFKFPFIFAAALVTGALCAGVLVTNFQYYIFRKRLLPVQKYLIGLYEDYWKDPALGEVREGLKTKMSVSLVSLTAMMVITLSIFNNIDGSKSLLFEWAKMQKARVAREARIMDVRLKADSPYIELLRLVSKLDDGSGAEFYLFDRTGNQLVNAGLDPEKEKILRSLVLRNYDTDDFMIVPHPDDESIALDLEKGAVMVNARIPIPKTNIIVLARMDYEEYTSAIMRSFVGSLVVLAISLIVAVAFARLFSEDLTKPIDDVVGVLKKISSGDLGSEMSFVSHDEMGVLAMNLKAMTMNLKAMILKIGQASRSVDTATLKMLEGFERVSEGARIQSKAVDDTSSSVEEITSNIREIGENINTLAEATQESSASIVEMNVTIGEVAESVNNLNNSVGETTSSIGEMASSIQQVAHNIENLSRKAENTVSSVTQMEASIKVVRQSAEETAQMSDTVASNAEEGKLQVQTTIDGIGRARQSSERAVEVIQSLADRARDIGNIVTVIKDITDQTNLLALNAAIIAAQAGERGRGFAVVADEIKNLAERTAQSTGEISSIIASVQKEATDAVGAVKDGYKVVEEGVELSKKAGEALDKILKSARQSTEQTRQIAVATVEQADRTRDVLEFFEEITESIRQLEVATGEQSKGASQIMASAENMNDITRMVKTATNEQRSGSKQIIEAIENINEIIKFIERSQREQAGNSTRILDAMSEIREIAVQNEADVDAMFQASSNLSLLAEELREMVGVFKLTDENKKEK